MDVPDLASRFSSYLALQRALAPSYVDGPTLPPFAGSPADDQVLVQLANSIGPLGRSLEALFRVANGVRAFNLFSLDLRSAEDIANSRVADVAWLTQTLTDVIDDLDDDDEELQTLLQTLRAAEPVILGASTARAELVLLHRADVGDEWSVSQLVNSRWWELPENTSETIALWLSSLSEGATLDAASKGITTV